MSVLRNVTYVRTSSPSRRHKFNPQTTYFYKCSCLQAAPLSSRLLPLTQVTVFITDVNDNSPKFTEISLPVEISEATSPLSTIATVSATDADSGDNARIKFYISDQSVEGLFVIDDQMTGIITLASGQNLDRDQL